MATDDLQHSTPTAEGADGREHHPFGFTMFLAGGGIKGGLAYGATDDYGYEAVARRPAREVGAEGVEVGDPPAVVADAGRIGQRPVGDEAVVATGALEIHAKENLRDVLRRLHGR